MTNSCEDSFQRIFSNCRRILGEKTWGRIQAALDKNMEPQEFTDALSRLKKDLSLPDFIVDLSRIEWIQYQKNTEKELTKTLPEKITANPTLELVTVSWKNLPILLKKDSQTKFFAPETGKSHVMIWQHPETGDLKIRDAEDIDLLALKIVLENIDPRQAAIMGDIHVRAIHTALDRAIDQGILHSPSSKINRISSDSDQAPDAITPYVSADIFTLQWHITQACDLHCRHCYDRSDRGVMPFDLAIAILDNFYEFCRNMHIKGQITFTGGNPLLYPRFFEIYQAAANRGFGIAILGNPTPKAQVEKLLKIEKPVFFQISLEGLSEHNDYIRGDRHFAKSLAFLDDLKALDIYSMVMLTLTRDNLDQVLPLSEVLTGRTDHFTFNRLSTVGEGKQLLMPEKKRFEAFLGEYAAAAENNPMLGLKDNLINIIHDEKGIELFGGCTGYGCGAAFNFVSMLPDGEVHACRKFPSPIGNILENSLTDIYQSDLAGKYRAGSTACRGCRLNAVCRGCFAVTYSNGLDIYKDRDPFCFIPEQI